MADPIGSSCLSLYKPENQSGRNLEKKYGNATEGELKELVASCRSLSRYESKTWKSLLPQILAALLAASFHVGNGISLAYSAVLIKQFENETDPNMISTKTQNAWIASVLIVVAPPASIIGGFIMDHLGRLNSIKIAGIPGVVGWSLIAVANSIPLLIVGRLLVGISSAWGTSPGIVYITEIASTNIRMSLMAIAPTYVALGMVFTYLGGWYLHWRTLAWICIAFIVLPCLLCIVLHESPSWLILKGKYESARKSLEWLHKYQPSPATSKAETYADLQYQFLHDEEEKKQKEGENKGQEFRFILKEFLKPTGWKPLVILTGLFFFQHFSGIYITMFYSITFIEAAGSTINPYFASIFIGLVRLVMSFLSIVILRTFRRRKLIFVSCISMSICMFVAGLWTKWLSEGTTEQNWVPVVALLLYVVASTIGLLPIPNMLMAELFPLEIRGIGYSVTYSMCCVFMFAALQSYYSMSEFFGGAAHLQWFFSIICLGGAVYAYIFMPETYGMKLRDITEYFKNNFLNFGKEITSTPASSKAHACNYTDSNENETMKNKETV